LSRFAVLAREQELRFKKRWGAAGARYITFFVKFAYRTLEFSIVFLERPPAGLF
jgi:hypothetical protein